MGKVGGKTPWYKREVRLGGGVKKVDLVMMAKHFSVMLRAGLTAPEALDVLVEQASGSMQSVLARVDKRVRSGAMLGDAMALEPKVFSAVFLSAVRIGEQSGSLADNLEQLSTQMEKDLTLRRNIQSAMLYPALVMTLAFVMGLGIATYVLPQIVGVFSSLNVELPWTTHVLIWIAEKFDSHGELISIGSILFVVFLIWLVRQPFMRPYFDRLTLKTPAISSFIHDINRARFCRTIGTLLMSGVPIDEALEIGAKVLPNVIYRSSVRHMVKRVATGDNFSDIVGLYPDLYPKVIHRMIAVGERSGSLGSILKDVAAFYEERVEIQAKGMSTLIEPILLIVIGGIVGLIAVSILTPIYSITSSISL
jgi:type IV pilus assembly protein PilC